MGKERSEDKKEKTTEQERSRIRISVRNLVEFLLREGDIDNRHKQSVSPEAMLEGSRMHRKIQKRQGSDYHAEVPLRLVITEENYDIFLEGRADGIQISSRLGREINFSDNFHTIEIEPDMDVMIDEIKGVYMKLDHLTEPVRVHKAQAMCYAYIFALQHDIAQIRIQMTYVNLDTEEVKYFQEDFLFESLQEWFEGLIEAYKKWADFQYAWKRLRQQSIKKLEFPFPYRKGQRDLVTGVYRTIQRKKNLFIQAPTGVGKTISTVFPAVKAVGENLGDRIFYLTAKTITGTVAREAFEVLRKDGYQAKVIQITAKEKMCLCDEMECNPDHCPYAKGHFDRVNDAVFGLLQKEDIFTREVLLEQAREYQVCPFEMSLDVASWADNIICDYNYVFDPNVYLKRFFADGIKGDYIFLVDEAHNLVERGREMYSATLVKEDILAVRKIMKPRSSAIEKELSKCNKLMLEYKRECETYQIYESIPNLIFSCMRLAAKIEEYMQKNPEFPGRDVVLDFYFELRNFLNIYERVDEHYVIYGQHDEEGRFVIKLFCVDPSFNLQECLDKGNATIFFSATLLPVQYYKELLTNKTDNYAVYARTTFSQDKRLLLIGNDVSSKYTRRTPEEYGRIADYIYRTIKKKKGNYMVFFPSYLFLKKVHEAFELRTDETITCICQESGMREEEREAFLEAFQEEKEESLVAFCVMGGIFGEGIDLKREQLIGAIIVGTGLPQISNEREILKDYYDKKEGMGFDYAYRYPGMNKVLQAAGRVIRTAEDVGIIELLDERFLQNDYQRLFPREWEQRSVCQLSNLEEKLTAFWEEMHL